MGERLLRGLGRARRLKYNHRPMVVLVPVRVAEMNPSWFLAVVLAANLAMLLMSAPLRTRILGAGTHMSVGALAQPAVSAPHAEPAGALLYVARNSTVLPSNAHRILDAQGLIGRNEEGELIRYYYHRSTATPWGPIRDNMM